MANPLRLYQENCTAFSVACLIAGATIILFIYRRLSAPSRLPPGPKGYPLLGALPLLKPQIHENYKEWAKQFGDIFCLWFGQGLVVVVSGKDAIQEVFVKNGEHLLDRPKQLKKGTYNIGEGVILGEGPVWREHRRQLTKGLRLLGSGDSLESRVVRECEDLVNLIAAQEGQLFDPTTQIFAAVMNISMAVFYGVRLEHGTEEFKKAYRILHLMEDMDFGNPLLVIPQFVPVLKPLCYLLRWKSDQKLQRVSHDISAFVGNMIAESVSTYDENTTRSILDTYLHRQVSDTKHGQQCIFDDNELIQVAVDMFIAGGDTTLATLRWGILYMLYNPGVLFEVNAEIDRVVGAGRLPAMKDRLDMPFTEATICEIQRCGNISSVGVPRIATRDIEVLGYVLPKGCQVAANLHYLHEDARYWQAPDRFDPSRFLGDSGQIIKPEAFLPFGLGQRICLGENLAKMELFLMFTTLMQRFDFRVPDGQSLPSLEIKRGITLSPHSYQILAEAR